MPLDAPYCRNIRLGARPHNDSGQHLPPQLRLQVSDSTPIVTLLDEQPARSRQIVPEILIGSNSSTAPANDSGSSAIRMFFPCSRPETRTSRGCRNDGALAGKRFQHLQVCPGGDLRRHDD